MKKLIRKLIKLKWQRRIVDSLLNFTRFSSELYIELQVKAGLYDIHHWKNPRIRVGRHTYGRPIIIIYDKKTKLLIGNYCSIGFCTTFILGGNHNKSFISTFPFSKQQDYRGDIIIGNDVWIGRDATILTGSKIGDGAIIGAKAVVAKAIPPYAIVVGNPGQIIGYRFTPDIIEKLLQIQWWYWPDSRVQKAKNLLSSTNINEFIRRYI